MVVGFVVKISLFWLLTYPIEGNPEETDGFAEMKYCPYNTGIDWWETTKYLVLTLFQQLELVLSLQSFGICFVILCIVLWLVHRMAKSAFGLALGAARQNEERVQAVGLTPYKLYLIAFAISGAITGLAGALFADLNRFVSPTMFSWQLSGEIMAFIIIGGVGRLFGPVVGALIFVGLEHWLGGLSDYWHVYLGLLLLLIVLFGRGGIIGMIAGRERSDV